MSADRIEGIHMTAAEQVASDAAGPATPSGSADGCTEPMLPRFLVRKDSGLYVDLERLRESSEFRRLIERLMAAGYLFRGIDYPAFSSLMFDYPPPAVKEAVAGCRQEGRDPLVRWAGALEHFDPVRATLYRKVTFEDGCAYYLFEPVCLDPEDGGEALQTRLDPDEFVIQMWLKGLRAGLDLDTIRDCIEHERYGRTLIARTVMPAPGTDATVVELWNGLHRDDRPRVLADGRADLTQFSNRFPQVKGGVRLLRKIAPVPGKPGRDLRGDLLAAPLPSDFEIEDLAGPGTRIEREDGEQYLTAAIDGFLDIDAATNQIAISEAIVHRQGVSVRTTGDLALMGEHFEEFGEIQERRTVEGRSITIHADVYGHVVSSGGVVRLERNLSGGSAVNRDGPIGIEGLVVNAWVHAPRGDVRLQRAEGAVISARRVIVEQAIACDIYAEEIEIADAQACVVGGTTVHLGQAGSRRSASTTVNLVLPRTLAIRKRLVALRDEGNRLESEIARAEERRKVIAEEPGLARYLKIASQLRSAGFSLNPEQKIAFEALGRRLAPQLKDCRALSAHIESARKRQHEGIEAMAQAEAELNALSANSRCVIDRVGAGVVIRAVDEADDDKPIGGLAAGELKAWLRGAIARGRALPHIEGQPFRWTMGEQGPG
ncbi:MAG: DUF342 domain-containing protein [Rhodocyclaceae bacterium]|nr:DUF342 domain-containing protein [Rhodocyclaceae bacterium]